MVKEVPPESLSRIYASAALSAAAAKFTGDTPSATLPAEPVLRQHPGISAADVDAYQRLLGAGMYDHVHQQLVPSVLVHTAVFPVHMALGATDDFPLPLMGMVHLHNEIHYYEPILVGQPLQILCWAENLQAHHRGTQVDLVAEIYAGEADIDTAEPVMRDVSKYLSRGVFLAGDHTTRPQREPFTPPRKTALWKLGADEGRQYAKVSGDYNPIHLTALSARALGMPRAIVHGMYLAGRMLLGREPEGAGHRWEVSFEAPVTLPATVAFAAELAEGDQWRFTGWNQRKSRRHFHGALHVNEAAS